MTKKILLISLLFVLMTANALADVIVTANGSLDVQSTYMTVYVTTNETCNVTEFKFSSNSDLSNPLLDMKYTDFALSHYVTITGLETNTPYYWRFNGTSNSSDTSYNTGIVTDTTLARYSLFDRLLAGFCGIVVFMLVTIGSLIFLMKMQKTNKTYDNFMWDIVVSFVIGCIGAMLVNGVMLVILQR